MTAILGRKPLSSGEKVHVRAETNRSHCSSDPYQRHGLPYISQIIWAPGIDLLTSAFKIYQDSYLASVCPPISQSTIISHVVCCSHHLLQFTRACSVIYLHLELVEIPLWEEHTRWLLSFNFSSTILWYAECDPNSSQWPMRLSMLHLHKLPLSCHLLGGLREHCAQGKHCKALEPTQHCCLKEDAMEHFHTDTPEGKANPTLALLPQSWSKEASMGGGRNTCLHRDMLKHLSIPGSQLLLRSGR